MEAKELTHRLVQLDEALQAIDSDIALALDDGTDIPEDLVARAESFAAARAENVNLVCDFLSYQEHEVDFLQRQAAEAKLRADRAKELHEKFKKLLAVRLTQRDGEPKLNGVGKVHLRAQRNGQSSLVFRGDDGAETTDDIVPNDYRVRFLTMAVPAAEESIKAMPKAIEDGKQAIIVLAPSDIVADVAEMVRGVAAFEGVDILTPTIKKMSGAESKAYVDNETLRKAIEDGREVPGVTIEQGYHLRYSKITGEVAKKG